MYSSEELERFYFQYEVEKKSPFSIVTIEMASAWNFIGTFFKNIFNGGRDYANRIPDKITLAIAPY